MKSLRCAKEMLNYVKGSKQEENKENLFDADSIWEIHCEEKTTEEKG